MKITGDYHTHSKYSKFNHGKSTIREMVESAREKGLKSIAITDHGPRHLFFGINRSKLPLIRKEVDELQKEFPDIKIYLGVEANLITTTGKIDISEKEQKYLDLCLLGFHRGAYGQFSGLLNLGNLLGNKKNPKRIKKNTNAYIKAIESNRINILTHLNEYILVDPLEIAKACAKHNVLIEINNRHLKITPEDIKKMLKTNVKFIINSDSHKSDFVGRVDNAVEFAEKYIPKYKIVNLGDEKFF